MVKDVSGSELLDYAMGRYSKAVILDRAIPDARDGLKPVHRRTLFTMFEQGIHSKAKHRKLAQISGLVLAYHPHNSLAISDAATLLSQSWRQRVPLIEIEGNNGSLDGDPAAADRYIEARLTEYGDLLLEGIREGAVDMHPTYDNEREEPDVLPASYPVLFTNGASGIAVGFSTDIPPHNPRELLEAAIRVNETPGVRLSTLRNIVKGPDFPTGGTVMGASGLDALYETGEGRFVIRGRAKVEDGVVIIDQIPYGISKADVYESIIRALVDEGLENWVEDVVDVSESLDVHIELTLAKGVDASLVVDFLYSKTKLEVNYTANHVAILNRSPVTLGLKEYLEAFVEFKQMTARRIFAREWDVLSARLEIVEGLLYCQTILDEVIALIRGAKDKADAKVGLVSKYTFSDAQAEAIVMMRLYRLSNQDVDALKAEQEALKERLEFLTLLAKDEDAFRKEISRQLKETKGHFKDSMFDRKTEIVDEIEKITIDAVELIDAQETVVVVKPYGAQRMSKAMYENNKEKLEPLDVFYGKTDQALVLFTKNGYAIQRLVDDLEYLSLTQDPMDLRREVKDFAADDIIIGSVLIDLEDTETMVLSGTKYGQMKRQIVSDSLRSFNNKGYLKRCGKYNGLKLKGDEVVYLDIKPLESAFNSEIELVDNNDRKRVVKESKITIQKASGSGANYLKVKSEDGSVAYKRL